LTDRTKKQTRIVPQISRFKAWGHKQPYLIFLKFTTKNEVKKYRKIDKKANNVIKLQKLSKPIKKLKTFVAPILFYALFLLIIETLICHFSRWLVVNGASEQNTCTTITNSKGTR